MKHKNQLLFLLFAPILATCSGCSPSPTSVFLITWKNHDGNILSAEKYNYGEMPSYKGATPIKPDTPEHSYTFSSWTPTLEKVTCDKEYIATFNESLKKYNVNWYNGETCLETDEVEYGTVPIYKGPTPQKTSDPQYDYSFSGWSPTVTAVTGPADYHAQFSTTTKKYLIIWQDDKGEELKRETLPYGSTPSYGSTPIKPSTDEYDYEFVGWSPAITSVTGPATYTAQFASYKKHLITFQNYDGKILETKKVREGSVPTYTGPTPTKASTAQHSYAFSGWSPSITTVVGPATYTAQFIAHEFGCIKMDATFPAGSSYCVEFRYSNGTLSKVDWGDGVVDTSNTHKYAATSVPTTYSITITSNFSSFSLSDVSPYQSGNKYISAVVIPNSVTSIDKWSFSYCSSLSSVIIPNSVTSIRTCAFSNCTSLKSVAFDSNSRLTTIGQSAFSYTGLTSINIPNSVTSIGYDAFSNCTSLQSITISDRVNEIGWSAFADCTSLQSIFIPKLVFDIGTSIFRGCTSLTSIIVDSNNPNYDSREGCNAIIRKYDNKLISGCKTTIIPNSVTSIENGAFENCSSLASINIPNGVSSIGFSAFSHCTSLQSITISDSVNKIGDSAFADCTSLQTVDLTAFTNPTEIPRLGSDAFDSCHVNLKFYVENNAMKDKFEKASFWLAYTGRFVVGTPPTI